MNFDKNYGNKVSFKKPLVKPLVKPIRSGYGNPVSYRSSYTNARGSYGFRFREHMEDVTEDTTVDSTGVENETNETNEPESGNFETESGNGFETELNSIEIPPELQAPEQKPSSKYNTDETQQETGDFFDYLKQTSESSVDKMKRFLGF